MAKFTYRMQSILNIQYQLETQAKMELGRAQMRLMEEEEKLQRLIDRKEAYLEEGRKMRSDKLHVNDLKDNRRLRLDGYTVWDILLVIPATPTALKDAVPEAPFAPSASKPELTQ